MSQSPESRVQVGWQSLRRARHAAALPRYLATAALCLFVFLGLRATFLPAETGSVAAVTPARADHPSEDFALQFARAYLSFNSAHPGRHAAALAPFTGGQLDPDAGLTATRGSQAVEWVEVASDQPALAGGRLITVAAGVSTQRLPLYLAVSVEHRSGQPLRLVGYPSIVGAPAIAAPEPAPQRETISDPALSEVIDRVLRNYLSGAAPDLRADLTPGAQVTLPTRRLVLEEVSEALWLGEPGSGAVLATMRATDADATSYTLTYELGISFRDRPYVDFIEVVPTAS